MKKISDIEEYFLSGFKLERPSSNLLWNAPLSDVAARSGGQWRSDRYYWPPSVFLEGLEFILVSERGIGMDAPFKEITALVGLDYQTGLWSDDLSLRGFDSVAQHLSILLGAPNRQSTYTELDGRFVSWEKGRLRIILMVVEMHCFRCYLTISWI
jgi:hypothetical protein